MSGNSKITRSGRRILSSVMKCSLLEIMKIIYLSSCIHDFSFIVGYFDNRHDNSCFGENKICILILISVWQKRYPISYVSIFLGKIRLNIFFDGNVHTLIFNDRNSFLSKSISIITLYFLVGRKSEHIRMS